IKEDANKLIRTPKSIYTIHNIAYQGQQNSKIFDKVMPLSEEGRNAVSYIDNRQKKGKEHANIMKGAIMACDALTTVSQSYAEEIKEPFFACGLENVIKENASKLTGIINGIDTESYNPETDQDLFANYGLPMNTNNAGGGFIRTDETSEYTGQWGKAKCKEELQKMAKAKVDANIPVIAVITRLTEHKGIDLVKKEAKEIIGRKLFSKKDKDYAQLIVLGLGDAKYEKFFTKLGEKNSDRAHAFIAFKHSLARQVYSGADIFLMPSKQEPCGLAQMIASRYGTVPVVRAVGGLKDTIIEGENGFVFEKYNSQELKEAVDRALKLYEDKLLWNELIIRTMEKDFSWNK
ncbi:MAG: glycogen synthase, partial [Anaerovoracaceae bacterium]